MHVRSRRGIDRVICANESVMQAFDDMLVAFCLNMCNIQERERERCACWTRAIACTVHRNSARNCSMRKLIYGRHKGRNQAGKVLLDESSSRMANF